jgi:hypothetical protein
MPHSESEIEELVQLARRYSETLAAYRLARMECRLSPQEDEQALHTLQRLDATLELLKSNSELERCRARKRTHVIELRDHLWKTAK